jgi:multisite-specific tRNA:(cytosine-C5)-methyltransferase
MPLEAFTLFDRTAQSLNAILKEVHVPALGSVEFEGQIIPPPVQIPWYGLFYVQSVYPQTSRYPEGLAWQFNVPKKVLRKQSEFKKFHSFLVFETEIVRPSERHFAPCNREKQGTYQGRRLSVCYLRYFLDVEPHHKV